MYNHNGKDFAKVSGNMNTSHNQIKEQEISGFKSRISHGNSDSISSAPPPEHLSEFYSFMNNKSSISVSPNHSPHSKNTEISEFRGQRMNRPPSLNTFTSFTPSVLDLPNILTSKDFENTLGTYQKVLDKAENFKTALLEVSKAANEFGEALEDSINECPKVNINKPVSDGLINAGSLQYIVGGNNQILARLLSQNFQSPIEKELHILKSEYNKNFEFYQKEIKAKTKSLRQKELENIKLSKLKTRNLTEYKANLVSLTNQLDEIDRLKYDYYHDINSMLEKFNQEHLLTKTGSIVRAELELFEGIARKGWSGGGLDQLLAISPDLFAVDYDQDDEIKDVDSQDITNTEATYDNGDLPNELESRLSNKTLDTIKLDSNRDNVSSTFDDRDDSSQWRRSPSPEPIQNREDGSNSYPTELDSMETPVRSLQELDESFSLPKINSNSLRNHQKTDDAYEKQTDDESFNRTDILQSIDD